jgi:deoxyadenosine/deoxycytidine kinase
MSRARIVIVEGNISAGKSTLSTYLGKQKGFRVFLEPTLKNPYLENFYQNPRKYALKMQIWLLRQRFYMYLAALRHVHETGEGVILDRSVFSDIVFAVKNKIDGNISEEGFKYYMQLREQMLEGLPIPDTTLFLDVSPVVCFERIHKVRCRVCLVSLTLTSSHSHHQT